MKRYILLLLITVIIISCATPKLVPTRFDNPIFNGILDGQTKFRRKIKLYPNYISDLSRGFDEKCEFLVQDEKAVMLKCDLVKYDLKDSDLYQLYYAKFKSYGMKYCVVFRCDYTIKNGYIEHIGMGYAMPESFYSSVQNCDGEVQKPYGLYEYLPNCMEVLRDKKWYKYIPAKMPEDLSRWEDPDRKDKEKYEIF